MEEEEEEKEGIILEEKVKGSRRKGKGRIES